MRIRTIKPEFWTNERLCLLSEFTRLLALALLNWADDHGYFSASPIVIRGALFPFVDDSKIILGSLQDLSRIDYIRLGKASDGREYGFIVKFSEHQRVDKPKDSRIKDLCAFLEHSTNNLGLIQDVSIKKAVGREGKGREVEREVERERKQKKTSVREDVIEEIYQAYPRKVDKGRAHKAITDILESKTIESAELLRLTKLYAVSPHGSSGSHWVKHPATWFNAKGYLDDQKEWQRNPDERTYEKRQGAYLSGSAFTDQIQAAMDAHAAKSDDGADLGEHHGDTSGTGDNTGETVGITQVPY